MSGRASALYLQIAWRHLRVGERPPGWAWPAFGLACYLLIVGLGLALYAAYGLAPEPPLDLPGLLPPGLPAIEPLAPPKQAYFGVLAALTLFLGGALLIGAVLSLIFTLLATVITISVMLGCLALVVVLSLMTGLELELRDKILGQRAHIRVSASDGRPFADYRELAERLAALPGVRGASPYLQGEVMVRSGFQRQGGILLGIDPDLHAEVSNLPAILREGEYRFLAHPDRIPEASLGFEILPIEPSKPPPEADRVDAGGGATGLPDGTGPEKPGKEDRPSADEPDEGWEDPEVEIPALRKRGALPAKAPAAPPRPRVFVPLAVEEEDGWEDPEQEISRLRAQGKLPPAKATPEPEEAEEPEARGAEEPEEETSSLRVQEADERSAFQGIFIGAEKAKELAARTGDQVQLITPIGRLTPAGRIPGVMAVKVAGVFDADHYEYDRWLVYATLPVAQAFLRAGDRVTGLEIKVDDIERVPERRREVEAAVAASGRTDLIVQDWQELNLSLFSAMALEKIAVFVALLCVILVASFGILGSNLMSVIEKSREIAILKTIGCTDGLIQWIFIAEGLCLGILGGLLGIGAGIGLCEVLARFGLPLSGSLHSFESLPVHVDGVEVLLVGLSSLLIVWLSSLYPARVASRMRPVDALRQAER